MANFMESSIISLRKFFLICFLAFLIFVGHFFITFLDNETKLVFCDVGQGDAAYIRVKNKIDVLVDAGSDRKVLSCLGRYMPFWDRKIELAIVSHPQKDHFGGFLYLLDHYQIEKMLMTPLDNPSQSFKRLKEKIAEKKITVDFPKAGTKINILNDKIEFYWPTEEFLAKNVIPAEAGIQNKTRYDYIDSRFRGNDNGRPKILGVSSLDDNNFSLVFLFKEDDFRALFTGDATPRVLNEIAQTSTSEVFPSLRSSSTSQVILKVPHHGSKNGLTKKFLQLANPRVAVISVGKKNPYGHPAKEILDMLKASGTKIRRTDGEGNIVFKIAR